MEAICILDFEQQEEDRKESKAPARFYEFYGVWFYGRLTEIVRQIAFEKFETELGKCMHAFIEPERIEKDKGAILSDGIHELTVYGHPCKLFKWMAQGYHRGLIVLADDRQGNAVAELYYESKTWGWMMKDSDKANLAELLEQQQ